MGKAITIEDVARMADVCIGTVSRVINSQDRVHPKTRERILQIIRKTGYRPSAMGRALVLGRSQSIMLLLHNIADPHCTSLAKQISRNCRTAGYKMLVGDSDYNEAIEAECLQVVLDRSVDGLIISPVAGRGNLALFRELDEAGFPVVSVMDPVPGSKIPCVKYDDVGAARMAVDYLLGAGHRNILFAGWHVEFQTVMDRYKGYVESHAAGNTPVRPELRMTLPKLLAQAGDSLAAAFALKPPPTAILAENEIVGLCCLNILSSMRRRVPEDVALIAFGDHAPEGSAALPMTSVSMGEKELGDRTLEILLEQMTQRGRPRNRRMVETLRPKLIFRKSA